MRETLQYTCRHNALCISFLDVSFNVGNQFYSRFLTADVKGFSVLYPSRSLNSLFWGDNRAYNAWSPLISGCKVLHCCRRFFTPKDSLPFCRSCAFHNFITYLRVHSKLKLFYMLEWNCVGVDHNTFWEKEKITNFKRTWSGKYSYAELGIDCRSR